MAPSDFGRVDAGLADSGGGLVDQRADGGGLHVDPRANLRERGGCPFEQGIERCGQARVRFTDAGRGSGAGTLDLGEAGRETVGRRGDSSIGLARALGKVADLRLEGRGLTGRLAADGAQLLGDAVRAFFDAGKVVEQHGNIVAGGFRGPVERLAMMLQLFAAAVEPLGDSGRACRSPHRRAA